MNQNFGVLNVHARPPVLWPHQIGVPPALVTGFQPRPVADDIEQLLTNADTVILRQVLTGLGGVGKTQLAAAYAHRARSEGHAELLIWINAGSRASMVTSYQSAAADLTVVTTRRRDAALSAHGRLLDIGVFTAAEALAFLEHRFGRNAGMMHEADSLAADLGYLPLALSQAAAYILDQGLDCPAYRRRWVDRRLKMDDLFPERDALPDDHRATVAATWSLSIEVANQLTPAGLAQPMLQIAAFLDANGIPDAVLTAPAALAHLTASTGTAVDADTAAAALACLHRLSLAAVDFTQPATAVRVHSLVQRAVRDQLDTRQSERCARVAADGLLQAWPDRDGYAVDLVNVLRTNALTLSEMAGPALWFVPLRRTRWAPRWLPKAVARAALSHKLLVHLGQSLSFGGQTDAAIDHYQRQLDTARSLLGEDHQQTFTLRNQIADLRGQGGDLAGAVAAFESLLDDRTLTLGRDYPDTLLTRYNLAWWHGRAEHLRLAVEELEALRDDYERILGGQHPQTVTTAQTLSCWRYELNGDAEATARELSVVSEQLSLILRADDQRTLTARHDLAWFRGLAGSPQAAVAQLTAVLAARRRVLGPDHPDVLKTRNNLARMHGEAGDPAGAVRQLESVRDDRTRVLGPYHPDTLTSRHHLAWWRGMAGDTATAATESSQLLQDYERPLGPDHPDTQSARRSLARWCTDADGTTRGLTERLALAFSGPQPQRHFPGESTLSCVKDLGQ